MNIVLIQRTQYARVAQWWSIALPRRGSRVRIPSRALDERISSVDVLFFVCLSPAGLERFEVLVPLRSSQSNVPGRSATEERDIRWVSLFLHVQAWSCRMVQKSLPYLALVAQQI